MKPEELWAVFNDRDGSIISVHTTEAIADYWENKYLKDTSLAIKDIKIMPLSRAIDQVAAAAAHEAANRYMYAYD